MGMWKCPKGPLNVWKVIDAYEILIDGTKKAVKLSIQEVPDDTRRHKEIIDHLIEYYLEDEPTAKATNHKQDPDGIKDYQAIWELALGHGVVTGCYQLDSQSRIDELVGVNVIFIYDDETDKVMKELKANFKSKYRGQKIGYHLLNARSAVAKTYDFRATSTFFTAEASQRPAERLGYEVRASVNYSEYLDDQGKPHYPNISAKSAKIMMKRLP